jgi:hypothetical protein
MLIDTNCYLGSWPFRLLRHRTAEGLARLLEQAGIEQALVSSLDAVFREDCHSCNIELLQAVARWPGKPAGPPKADGRLKAGGQRQAGKLLPLAVANPTYAGWQQELESLISKPAGPPKADGRLKAGGQSQAGKPGEWGGPGRAGPMPGPASGPGRAGPGRAGIAGIRLHPNYHGYEASGDECAEVIEWARDRGLPVFIAVRLQDERQHHPACQVPAVPVGDILRLCQRAQGASVVACMVRFGEAEKLLASDTAGGARLMCDLSGIQGPAGCIDKLVEKFGSGGLLLGTGAPLQYPLPAAKKLEFARISEAQRREIGSDNWLRLSSAAAAEKVE